MQYERFNYACVVMYEKIYVAGGQSADDSYLCSVECYDPEADEWTKIANMNHARASFGLAERNGMLYAFGHHETIEQYDPNRDVWSKVWLIIIYWACYSITIFDRNSFIFL